MNKDLASEIIRIANSLDVMGFVKEANSLDKIARKVISQDATIPEPENDYTKDIQTYKKLVFEDATNTKRADKFATKVYQSGYLTEAQKKAFTAQKERIIGMYNAVKGDRGQYDKINKDLYDTMFKNKLDEQGISTEEFENRWQKSKLNKTTRPQLETYNILKSRFQTTKV